MGTHHLLPLVSGSFPVSPLQLDWHVFPILRARVCFQFLALSHGFPQIPTIQALSPLPSPKVLAMQRFAGPLVTFPPQV